MERMPFSKYVAKKRALLGKNQKQLAEALSYTPQAISRFESLNSAFPIELLDPLCKFLECSIDDLLERNLESSAYRKVTIDWDSLPKNLAEARKSSSLSKEAFAEALGISSRVIRNYESGSTTPSFQLLESWADLSKKQAADFLKKPVVIPQKPPHAPLPFYKRRPILIPLIAVVTIAVPAASIAIPFAVKETKRNGSHSETSSLNEESSPIEESSVSSSFEVPSSSESESFSSPDEGSSSVSSTESQESSLIEESSVPSSFEVPSSSESESFSSPDEGSSSVSFTESSESSSSSESLPPVSYDAEPVLSEDGKILTYGIYPQTYVADESLISSLNEISEPESNGWYLHEGNYFVKKTAHPIHPFAFGDKTSIEADKEYWFRCEPIEWQVLSYEEGEAFVVSKLLLDIHEYDDNSNVYSESLIREYLNSDFLNSAFFLGGSAIQTTHVDNTSVAVGHPINPEAHQDTDDKVFLLSGADLQNAAYGFTNDETRMATTTDYVRAIGGDMDTGDFTYGRGHYWTRSLSSSNSYIVCHVYCAGNFLYDQVNRKSYCIRPAITVKI